MLSWLFKQDHCIVSSRSPLPSEIVFVFAIIFNKSRMAMLCFRPQRHCFVYLTNFGESLRSRGFLKGGPRSTYPRNGWSTCHLDLGHMKIPLDLFFLSFLGFEYPTKAMDQGIVLSINSRVSFRRIHQKETHEMDSTKAHCCKLVQHGWQTRSSTFRDPSFLQIFEQKKAMKNDAPVPGGFLFCTVRYPHPQNLVIFLGRL